MKKIIVHIGLPKTATTTLQHDLFQKLHDEGKINFLGKTLNYDLQTRKIEWLNTTGQIIRNACEEKVKINPKEIESILAEDKINIFSDEGLSVYYPGLKNISLEKKIKNLKSILSNYDTTIVITLRNQIDYMYSLYVQLYSDFYQQISHLNSFEKYCDFFLKNKENELFEYLNYEKYLNTINNYFKLNILLYEDLKHKPERFHKQIEDFFFLEKGLVKQYLNNKHKNKKTKYHNQVYKVQSYRNIVNIVKEKTNKESFIFKYLSKIYNSNKFGLKVFLNKNRKSNQVHRKPNIELKNKLKNELQFSSNLPYKKFNLNKELLTEYDYIKSNIENA